MTEIDHIVYAGPDLGVAVDRIAGSTGCRPVPGGRHPGWGTRNALLALGEESYLEVLGPDPDRPDSPPPTLFGLDRLTGPRIVAWAAKASELETRIEAAAARGVELGEIVHGSRETPSGDVLRWRLTDPGVVVGDGLVPFLIEWGDTPHPAAGSPGDCCLLELHAEHPEPERIRNMLEAVGIRMLVAEGSTPTLVATLHTPRGEVQLV